MDIKISISSAPNKPKEKELNDFLNDIDYNARPYILKELAMIGLEMKREVMTKFYASLKSNAIAQALSIRSEIPPEPPTPTEKPVIPVVIPPPVTIPKKEIKRVDGNTIKDRLLKLVPGQGK